MGGRYLQIHHNTAFRYYPSHAETGVNTDEKHRLQNNHVEKFQIGERVPSLLYGAVGVIMEIESENGHGTGPGTLVVSPLVRNDKTKEELRPAYNNLHKCYLVPEGTNECGCKCDCLASGVKPHCVGEECKCYKKDRTIKGDDCKNTPVLAD